MHNLTESNTRQKNEKPTFTEFPPPRVFDRSGAFVRRAVFGDVGEVIKFAIRPFPR